MGDAAWLTGLERNADIVVMNCYAPLICNVNPGGMQWSINLIGYDALRSYGSPAYFVQKMFSNNRGNVVLPTQLEPLPTLTLEQIPRAPVTPGGRGGAPGSGGPAGPFDAIYATASRENASGDIILKLVNVQAAPQALKIDLKGVQRLDRIVLRVRDFPSMDGKSTILDPDSGRITDCDHFPSRKQIYSSAGQSEYDLRVDE